jgi:hypothetical protein
MSGRPRVRSRVVLLVAALLSGCTAGTGQPSAVTIASMQAPSTRPTATSNTPSPTAAGRAGALVDEADGLSLTVTLDRTTVAPGEVVTFSATFQNGGTTPMDYSVPWCGGAAAATVSVALPQEPRGKEWSGIAQVFKDYVLAEAYGPGGVPALDPVLQELRAQPCEQDEEFMGVLDPGKSITSSLPWTAEIVPGVDALAGIVPFRVTAGYDQQNGPPSYPPDYKGPRGSWVAVYKQLEVTGTIDVVGHGRALAGPGEVLDSLLANAKFARWLTEQPRRTWSNANFFLTSSPKGEGIVPAGPSWDVDLFREVGVPRHWAIAFLDPFDASLRSVTYCNNPCDR